MPTSPRLRVVVTGAATGLLAALASSGTLAPPAAATAPRATASQSRALQTDAQHAAAVASATAVATRSGRALGPRAAARPTRVTAVPSSVVAAIGSSVAARGSVAGGGTHPVRLQRKAVNGWATVATSSTRNGRYVLRVPTRSAGTQTLRVLAGATGSAVSRPFSVGVGAGNPRSVAYLTRPAPRWDPCRPITYRVNLARAPRGAAADVDRSIAKVSAATGLRFVKAGSTTVVPGSAGRDILDEYPRGTDLVVAYSRPGASGYLPRGSRTLGVGGAFFEQGTTAVRGREWHRILQGYLVVDGTQGLPGGFGPGNVSGYQGTWGQVLMHELGHVVGLDHPGVRDPRQIMHVETTRKPAVWGAGDLVGLRALGSASGCF
ncbi:hypothetical protein [Agilicoccus flavus]|uniref:hypothetical protein n=1 Tax=Agilicoccus flavus TaxID=2775968 RepID=UPI001CF6FD9D|nr:hypothetical protein [Agilicoccus flavus]